MAAALRRSDVSFRSQGSSGVVWSGMFYSGEINRVSTTTKHDVVGEITEVVEPSDATRRCKSATVDRGLRTADPPPPSFDPPSPKLSGCGLCRLFGKPVNSKQNRKKRQPS